MNSCLGLKSYQIFNMMINKEITIEELVNEYPGSMNYLGDKGIRCIRCGEPIWGTLESAAWEKGFSGKEIDEFVRNLKQLK